MTTPIGQANAAIEANVPSSAIGAAIAAATTKETRARQLTPPV